MPRGTVEQSTLGQMPRPADSLPPVCIRMNDPEPPGRNLQKISQLQTHTTGRGKRCGKISSALSLLMLCWGLSPNSRTEPQGHKLSSPADRVPGAKENSTAMKTKASGKQKTMCGGEKLNSQQGQGQGFGHILFLTKGRVKINKDPTHSAIH